MNERNKKSKQELAAMEKALGEVRGISL
jgi:hypothetical protein